LTVPPNEERDQERSRDGPLSIPGVYCVGTGAMADAVYINVGDGARRDARRKRRRQLRNDTKLWIVRPPQDAAAT